VNVSFGATMLLAVDAHDDQDRSLVPGTGVMTSCYVTEPERETAGAAPLALRVATLPPSFCPRVKPNARIAPVDSAGAESRETIRGGLCTPCTKLLVSCISCTSSGNLEQIIPHRVRVMTQYAGKSE